MNRLVLLVAMAAIALIAPAAAHAEGVTLNANVLTVTGGSGTVDTLALSSSADGTTVSDTTTSIGTVGRRCSALSATSAVCPGATSLDVQTMDANDSIVNSSALPGTLDGGAGDDRITGDVTGETIRGGDGNDVITAGAGSDAVYGGTGDDRIDVRDGAFDLVDCGEGNDTLYADRMDWVFSCESVNPVVVNADGTTSPTAPLTTTTGGADGPAASAPADIDASTLLAPVTVAGPVTAKVREGERIAVGSNGKAALMLGCSVEEAKACSGVIFVDPVTKKAKGKKSKKSKKSKRARQAVSAFMARRGRYGSSPFKVKPGSEDKVDLKLTGIALKALGKKSRSRKGRNRKARAARRGRSIRAVVTIAPKRAQARRVTIVLKG